MISRVFAIFVLAVSLSISSGAGEVIDRIVASVNNQPVLQSDWEDAIHFEAFLQGRPQSAFTESERLAVLDRLVDQELLRQQMQADFSQGDERVEERVKQVRAQVVGNGSDEQWRAVLAKYGLSEALLHDKLTMQMQVLRFVDLRLRPAARVDREDILDYYRTTLVPELQKAGATPEPLEQVSGKIRELLAQQRMDVLLTAWLSNLRGQSAIRWMLPGKQPQTVGLLHRD